MAKDMCRFHPHVFASGECKQCSIPICDDCKTVQPQGIFCSAECAAKFAAFQDRLSAHKGPGSGSFLSSPTIRTILVLGVVLLAFWLFLHFVYDVGSLGDIPSALKSMWFDFIGFFR